MRVTRPPHGLSISESCYPNFKAMVWCVPYVLKHISTPTLQLQTPAQQVIWRRTKTKKRVGFTNEVQETYSWEPLPHIKNWLTTYASGHAYYPPGSGHSVPRIFFEEVEQAVSFCCWIEEMLEGIQIGR